MLTHELITNSIEHSEGRNVWVTVLALPDAVRVEVTDEGGSSAPSVTAPEPLGTSGRGLLWVSNLADHWGVERRVLTSVWFQFNLDVPRELTGAPVAEYSEELSSHH